MSGCFMCAKLLPRDVPDRTDWLSDTPATLVSEVKAAGIAAGPVLEANELPATAEPKELPPVVASPMLGAGW